MKISDVLHHAERGVVILESADDKPFLFLTRDENVYPDFLDEYPSDEWGSVCQQYEFVDVMTGEASSVDLASFKGRVHLNVLIGDLEKELDVMNSITGYTIFCPIKGASFSSPSTSEELQLAMDSGIDPESDHYAAIPSKLVVDGEDHHIILDINTLVVEK